MGLFKRKKKEPPPCKHEWVKLGEKHIGFWYEKYHILFCPLCEKEVALRPEDAKIELVKSDVRKDIKKMRGVLN